MNILNTKFIVLILISAIFNVIGNHINKNTIIEEKKHVRSKIYDTDLEVWFENVCTKINEITPSSNNTFNCNQYTIAIGYQIQDQCLKT